MVGHAPHHDDDPKLKWDHITTLMESLKEFVRSTDQKNHSHYPVKTAARAEL